MKATGKPKRKPKQAVPQPEPSFLQKMILKLKGL